MEFKENLKRVRMEKGLTQAQLAEKLFVSRSTVAKWENGLGLPNPDSMATLEQLFEISAAELATQEPEKAIVTFPFPLASCLMFAFLPRTSLISFSIFL
jgi:transcriptional regulator with XRE-family HTH domain